MYSGFTSNANRLVCHNLTDSLSHTVPDEPIIDFGLMKTKCESDSLISFSTPSLSFELVFTITLCDAGV